MSEIIASIYNYKEETGIEEGILFLDEINCVSETLSPAMLQFLQYKTFGNHLIPKGWVIVTAGNPPEYNKSVREFDVATLDRVKKIDVEAEFAPWKEYAIKKGIHASIITYLEIKKDHFYNIETTIDGKNFVTARGWEDLSQMIFLYEEIDIKIDENLCRQYIQNKNIAKDFSMYYDLYNKYKSDYKVLEILDGKYSQQVKERASNAKFDERIALIGLLMDTVIDCMKQVLAKEEFITILFEVLKILKNAENIVETLITVINERKIDLEMKRNKGLINKEKETILQQVIFTLEDFQTKVIIKNIQDNKKIFSLIKKEFEAIVKTLDEQVEKTKGYLENMLSFIEDVYGKEQETLLVVTELTANFYSANFIGKYGSEKYFQHNKELLFYERQKDIMKELSLLDGMMQ